jgi:hypothetical protein
MSWLMARKKIRTMCGYSQLADWLWLFGKCDSHSRSWLVAVAKLLSAMAIFGLAMAMPWLIVVAAATLLSVS